MPFEAAPPAAPAPASPAIRQARFWPLWAAALLLPLLVFAGGAWWAWRSVQAEMRLYLLRTTDMLHEHALRAFEAQEGLLTAVALRLHGMSWEEIAASRELYTFLHDLDSRTPGLGGIVVIAPDGRIAQASMTPFPAPRVDLSNRDFVLAHRRDGEPPADEGFVGRPFLGQLSSRLVFPYSRPLPEEGGRAGHGVVNATFALGFFQEFYGRVAEAPGDLVALVRIADGTVLARHPSRWPLGTTIPADAPARAAIDASAAAGGRAGLSAGYTSFDGEPRLFAARVLEDYPVAVVYALHRDGPRTAWLRQVAVLGAVSGSAAALLLSLTWRVRDATRRERTALEQARRQAERNAAAEAALRDGQRLSALGEIASGVAHDFRNTAQAVQGGARLIERAAGDVERVRVLARMMAEAATRSAALTDRMLAIARRGDPSGATDAACGGGDGGGVADPMRAVAETGELLRGTLGAGWRLRCEVGEPGALPARVRGRTAELESALLNLAINARDAMPQGGEILISAGTETVAAEDDGAPPHPAGMAPGRYARIAVADTGIGMDSETLARAGQPFFTTKPPGRGTGLGLASVRALAEQAGGAMRVESPGPGRGTTVTLWLPEVAEGPGGAKVSPPLA